MCEERKKEKKERRMIDSYIQKYLKLLFFSCHISLSALLKIDYGQNTIMGPIQRKDPTEVYIF